MVDQQDDRPFNQPSSEPTRSRLDILALPELQQQVLRIVTRERAVGFAEIVRQLNQEATAIQTALTALVEQGFIQQTATETETAGEPQYQTRLAPRRGRLGMEQIWQRLEGEE